MKYQKVTPNMSAEIKVLYQIHGIKGDKLLSFFPNVSKANVYKHARKPIGHIFSDGRKLNTGRPRKISEATTRRIKREVEVLTANGGFTSHDIQHNIGAIESMSNRTVRRELNRLGIKYLHLRKKGVLLPEDLVIRKKFAKKCKRILPGEFWTKGVSMYLDGVGFEFKRNPGTSLSGTRTMGWRRKSQGLDINNTSKGKKEGRKNANFYVGISYGKGVVTCKGYTGQMNANRYSEIIVPKIEDGLKESINPTGKRIIQDNCKIMNSQVVVQSLTDIGAQRFKIPARSPDINCIENVFHAMRRAIQQDAVTRKIHRETFRQFQYRAGQIIRNFDSAYIDKVIESMPKRIDMVIQRNGQRIKY